MSSRTSILSQLEGAWELIEYSLQLTSDQSNKLYHTGRDTKGIILYTHDGYMSAQLHSPGQKPFKGEQPFDRAGVNHTAESDWAAVGRNYIAYTGEFYIDEHGSKAGGPIIRHHMRCASLPYMVGNVQSRVFKFENRDDGRYLILGLEEPMEVRGERRHIYVAWRKLPLNERGQPMEPRLNINLLQ